MSTQATVIERWRRIEIANMATVTVASTTAAVTPPKYASRISWCEIDWTNATA